MRNHYIVKLITIALAFNAASAIAAQSEEHISSVRRAAIEKLQDKLGTMRGSIKPKQKRVYLTPIMIEQLKPITPKSHLVAKQLDEEKSAESVEIDYQEISPDFVIAPVNETYADNSVTSLKAEKQIITLADEAVKISKETNPAPVAVVQTDETIDSPVIEVSQHDDVSSKPAPPKIKISERSERLRREIFSAIRMREANPSSGLVTNSISEIEELGQSATRVKVHKAALPNTSDVEVLLRAVDEMIANGD